MSAFVLLRETFFRCWNEFKRATHSPGKASYYRGLRDGINAELTSAKRRAENTYTEGQMGS